MKALLEKGWWVGSSGDWFRDMNGARYCISHEIVGYEEDGRRKFKFAPHKNGNGILQHLVDTEQEAAEVCEKNAGV